MNMVNDVETVLKEIRERVIAENSAALRPAVISSDAKPAESSLQVGNGQLGALERLSAQLAVTARAWDRLPPVISNRRGALGRVEIWIKKICKPLTRWFTWEQINFNAAVHHALLDGLAVLSEQQEELRALNHWAAEVREYLGHVDATLKQYDKMMSELAAEMRKGHADLTKEIHERFPEMASTMDGALQRFARDIDAKIADLHAEQRVCFKQLSLQASEAAVLEDRGRRSLESRVERLEQGAQESK